MVPEVLLIALVALVFSLLLVLWLVRKTQGIDPPAIRGAVPVVADVTHGGGEEHGIAMCEC